MNTTFAMGKSNGWRYACSEHLEDNVMETFTTLICALLAASLHTATQSHDPVRKLLEAKYVAYVKAFAAKDPTFIEKMLSPDYAAEQPGRPSMNRQETLKTFSGLMASSEDVKWPRKT